MKFVLLPLLCVGAVFGAEAPLQEETPVLWTWGADLRIRQEMMDNIPGHPNEPGTAYPAPSGKNLNWFRFRTRAWTAVETEPIDFYFRVANEMREHVVTHGVRRDDRSYTAPDELFVDQCYLKFKNLWDDRLDIKIGRQDFIDNGRFAFGAGRVLQTGMPYDGSRALHFDAIRMTLKTTEKSTLDLLAIYNAAENEFRIGRPTPNPRPENAIDPRDSAEMDEYGGGLYYKNREFGDELAFELYYLYKRETSFHRLGVRQPGRYTHTVGGRFLPQLTETLSAELEAAAQAGEKDSDAAVSGMMGFAGLVYRPDVSVWNAKPHVTASCYYLSGDKQRGGANDDDSGWNPLWSRWPQDSEMLVYGPLQGLGYWSNMIFPSVGGGLDFSARQRIKVYAGPMFCAAQDHLGGGDSSYQGTLGVIRYDFPIWKNKKEGGLGEIFGHLLVEGFQPGDYYTTDKTAYFFRWEISARF